MILNDASTLLFILPSGMLCIQICEQAPWWYAENMSITFPKYLQQKRNQLEVSEMRLRNLIKFGELEGEWKDKNDEIGKERSLRESRQKESEHEKKFSLQTRFGK